MLDRVEPLRGQSTTLQVDDLVGPFTGPEVSALGVPYVTGGIVQVGSAVPAVGEGLLLAGLVGYGQPLKQAMKAKYDLPQWQQVIGPVQDVFREKKRDAMVSYLVTHPDQTAGHGWADSNGLYSAYLIDVKMNSPMLTSRLKQAASSTQLFVQRCRQDRTWCLGQQPR